MRKPLSLSFIVLAGLSIVFVGCSKPATKTETPTTVTNNQPEPAAPEAAKPQTPEPRVGVSPTGAKPASAEKPKKSETPAAEPTKKPATTAAKPAKSEKIAEKPAGTPTLVDVGGENCIPCKLMIPVLNDLSTEYKGKLKVEIYDIYKDDKIAAKFGVLNAPTQIFLDGNGKILGRHFGFISKKDVIATFKKYKLDIDKE